MKFKDDLLTARRDGNGIILTYTHNGKMKQARVTKHPEDKDNFLLGVEYVLRKMQGRDAHAILDLTLLAEGIAKLASSFSGAPKTKAPASFYQVGDRVLLPSRYIAEYINPSPNINAVIGGEKCNLVTIHETDRWNHCLIEEDNREYRWSFSMFVGKIVPCGELKRGDEVFLKSGKIVEITRISGPAAYAGDYCVNVSDTSICYPIKAFGKLIRPEGSNPCAAKQEC